MSLQEEEDVHMALVALGRGMRAARERRRRFTSTSGRARDEPGDGDEEANSKMSSGVVFFLSGRVY